MNKAILMMDMPEHCDKCPCLKNMNGINYCSKDDEVFKKIGKANAFYYTPKPDWCPLIPEPPIATPDNSDMSVEWNIGWNACIDYLEGKANE